MVTVKHCGVRCAPQSIRDFVRARCESERLSPP
jgi:hypothetical protein